MTDLASFNRQLTPSLLLVVGDELDAEQTNNDDAKACTGNAGVDTWVVVRRVLAPEHQTTRNTTDTAKADQSRTAEGTLPLPSDVVGLVRHGGRHVRVRSGAGKEDTKVSDANILVEPHQRETDEDENHVEDNDRSTKVPLITSPASKEHNDTGEDIWRSDQALSCANAVAHTITEDDGKEIGEGVRNSRSVEEDHSETPDLDVRTGSEELAEMEGFDQCIATVSLDSVEDELDLALVQEFPGFVLAVREVHKGPVATKTDQAGELQLSVDEDHICATLAGELW